MIGLAGVTGPVTGVAAVAAAILPVFFMAPSAATVEEFRQTFIRAGCVEANLTIYTASLEALRKEVAARVANSGATPFSTSLAVTELGPVVRLLCTSPLLNRATPDPSRGREAVAGAIRVVLRRTRYAARYRDLMEQSAFWDQVMASSAWVPHPVPDAEVEVASEAEVDEPTPANGVSETESVAAAVAAAQPEPEVSPARAIVIDVDAVGTAAASLPSAPPLAHLPPGPDQVAGGGGSRRRCRTQPYRVRSLMQTLWTTSSHGRRCGPARR